jgi:hypothetical protein
MISVYRLCKVSLLVQYDSEGRTRLGSAAGSRCADCVHSMLHAIMEHGGHRALPHPAPIKEAANDCRVES